MNRLALIVVSFLIGGGTAWTLAARSAPPAPPSGPARPYDPAPVDPGRWDEVLAALARIESRLDAAPAAAPAPAQTEDNGAALAELLAELGALRAELAGAATSAGAGSSAAARDPGGALEPEEPAPPGYDLLALKEAQPEPDWKALRKLIELWNRDEQAARQDAQLLGYRDVLERYGNPTEVWGTNESLNWLYVDGIDPFTGETVIEVWFQFVDGFVVQLGVKQP